MNHKFTFRTIIKDKPNKSGLFQIYIEVYLKTSFTEDKSKRIRRNIPTGLHVKKSQWSQESKDCYFGGGVKGHPMAKAWNESLNMKIWKVMKAIDENPSWGIDDVANFMLGKRVSTGKKSLTEYIDYILTKNPQQDAFTTLQKKQRAKDLLIEFFQKEDIYFEELDRKKVEEFECFLTKEREKPFLINTAQVFIAGLRSVYNQAIKDEIIEDNGAFKRFRVSYKNKTSKVFLKDEEIAKIEQMSNFEKEDMFDARNIFLFQFYTAGDRISDCITAMWEHITDENYNPIKDIEKIIEMPARFTFEIYKGKSNKKHSILLIQEAKEILLHYYKTRKNSLFIFPYLPDDFLKEKKEIKKHEHSYRKVKLAIGNIDYNLKKISETLGIRKISSHTARRSFAEIAKSNHGNIADISKALGHSNIQTTQGYFDKDDFSGVDRVQDSVHGSRKSNLKL